MTPEQKAEAMRLVDETRVACAVFAVLTLNGKCDEGAAKDSDAAYTALDSYLTALIDKPTIARIDGEGSSSLD